MRSALTSLVILLCVAGAPLWVPAGGGITPEQIYQDAIKWDNVVGTWEILPETNPLGENGKDGQKPSHRPLMTLRKDGTCRVFNQEFPMGRDGMWTMGDHEMFITFQEGSRIDFFVYGVKGDFMITRSPAKEGKDQLWSRVK